MWPFNNYIIFYLPMLGSPLTRGHSGLPILTCHCGGDVPKLEPKTAYRRLTFWTLDLIIKNLRHMHKEHTEWFEVPKPKSDKGKSEVDYSV